VQPGSTHEHILATDVPACGTECRKIVVACAMLDADCDGSALARVAYREGAQWCTLDEATGSAAHAHVAAALTTAGSFRRTPGGRLGAPRAAAGARGLFALARAGWPSAAYDAHEWEDVIAETNEANVILDAALRATGDAWFDGWADAIVPFRPDDVPGALRQRQAPS
jgi:hypothetical protein